MHLESFSVVQLVSPVATEEPQSERERNRRKSKPVPSRVTALMMMMTTAEPCATSRLVSSILVARAEQQLSNDPSSIYQTPQRSFSKGSFIHLAPPSPSTPHQTSPGSHQQSPCPSIDEMLDSAAEELPSAVVLNPEPLWQLEFSSSCWQRMSNTPAAITSNLVLDVEESR